MSRTKPKPTKKQPQVRAEVNGTAERPDVLTLDEAALYLRVAAAEVVRMIDAEQLPARKFGKEWRFYKAALQNWLSQPSKRGFLWHAGRIKDDPYLEDMLRDIYAQRGRPETEEG